MPSFRSMLSTAGRSTGQGGGGVQFTLRRAKEGFVDADRIEEAVDRANRRNLARYGAYVRADAMENIRNRGRPSKPGQGPTNQTGLLRDKIPFSLEAPTGVVIGPVRLPNMPTPGGMTVPELLEYGGTVRRRITRGFLSRLYKRRHRDPTAKSMFRSLRSHVGEVVQFDYEPRPYMGPAQRDNRDQVPRIWENSIIGR